MRLVALFLFICLSSFSFTKKSVKEHHLSLKTNIDHIISMAEREGHIGVEIISLKTGQLLYQKNQKQFFVPCSTVKLFTAAAALHYLGPDFRFETAFYTDGPIEKGILRGNLYLKGSGDPEFSLQALDKMIAELLALQIKEIRGDLVIDTSCFDGVERGPGWMWDEGTDPWNSPLDGLMINHSCIDLWVSPAQEIGRSPHVTSYPKTSYVQILNHAQTSDDGEELQVSRLWMEKGNQIEIAGKIAKDAVPQKFTLTIENPSQYTAVICRELLKKNRIYQKGEIVRGKVENDAHLLVRHQSTPLSLLLYPMLKESDNLYANALFKKCGQVFLKAPGSWQGGAQAIRQFLKKEAGISVEGLVMLDGNGESRYNLVTPKQMSQFLKWAYDSFSFSPELVAALPIGGLEGSLAKRYRDLSLRAKTGTMTGLSGLAGYVTTADGEPLAFTIYESGTPEEVRSYKSNIEDKICAFLSDLSK